MARGLNTLESLTDTAIDSAIGYERAAERAKAAHLKTVLSEQATKRRRLVDELNREITRLGGKPRDTGSMSGAAHRVWTDISSAFADANEAAAERVEEGEDYIEKKFREALDDREFEPETRTLLQRAHAEVKEGERLTDRLDEQYD